MEKLNFDKLYDEAEKAKREGECPLCEEWHMLCWCGVCFSCHDDYFHEDPPPTPYEQE